MQRDLQFLLDILQSAELIMTYTAQCSKDKFVSNVKIQDSVIRRLLVIAESTRRVSEATALTLALSLRERELESFESPSPWGEGYSPKGIQERDEGKLVAHRVVISISTSSGM